MYKKDQQHKIVILIILAVLLLGAMLLDWHTAALWIFVPFIIVLILTLFDFQQRLMALEQQLQKQATETLSAAQPHSTQAFPASHVPTSTPAQAEPAVPVWMQNDIPSTPVVEINVDSISRPESVNVADQDTWWQPALEWMKHGNPILRVAIAVLMVGIVLLLRFASEHWQLSLGLKLGFIASAGAATTVLGYILQKKNQLFAVAIQGAGLAIIFLTLVFSHHFAVIANLTTASILFVILLAVTVYLSLRQQALYLAMLALTMAYLAPLVIPHQHPDVIFLFTYYLVINLAVAAVNFIQPWKILHQIAFFATMLIGGTVIGIYGKTQQFNTLDMILWLHIALFIWLSIRYSQLMLKAQQGLESQQNKRLQPMLDVGLIFSVPVLGFSLHAFLMHNSTQAMTWGAVALALVYASLNVWIKRQHPQLSILAKSFFILSMVFTALIFPLAQGASWTATGWVIQGTALIVWGVTERYRLSRYLGVALVLLSSIALLLQIWSNEYFPTLSTVIYAVAQFISAYYLLNYQQVEKYFSARMLSGVFLVLGMYAGAVAGVEFMQWESYGLSPYLAIAAVLLALFSTLVHYQARLEWQGLKLLLVGGLLCLLYGESVAIDIYIQHHWPSILQQSCFMLAIVGMIWVMTSIKATKEHLPIWSGLLWLGLALIGLVIFPMLPLVALAFIPLACAIGFIRTQHSNVLAQVPVLVLSLLWLILVSFDVYSAQQYYVLPILNLNDLTSLAVFMGIAWVLYQHQTEIAPDIRSALNITTIVVGLLVFSSVVVRAMHHYLGTPLWSMEIWSNGNVQLSLTLLWVTLAFILMTFSSRRHIRQIWFVGAALLAIVVAKLLLLDLSQSGTLTRVISFIGSGIVMLIIAYIAPLPPAIEHQHKESN